MRAVLALSAAAIACSLALGGCSRESEPAQMLGVTLVDGGSDSQDLDRVLATLIHRYHYSLT
jgi:hypothetical protein